MASGFREGRLGTGGSDAVPEARIGFIGLMIGLVFVVFVGRLFQLQIVEGADLRDRSERNRVRAVRLEAPRGDIVDREGRVLATSRPAFRVQVIPDEVREPEKTYVVLADLLGSEARELSREVGEPRGRERFQPVVLDGDLPYEGLARIESHRYALAGVVTDQRPRRHYPEERLAAHLLGTIGEIQLQQLETEEFGDYHAGEVVGQRGLESVLEPHVRGRQGGRNLVVDVAGREIEVLDEVAPAPGGRAVLAIDLDLQRIAEQSFVSLDPEVPDRMGAVVAVDPRNGDVLVLASRPSYDPNDFAGGIASEIWSDLMQDEWRPLQDRALSGRYSPGSTYKAIVAAAGLAEGTIDPEETVYCPGHFRLGRRVYRCWKRAGHGDVNLEQALQHSCDVYFYQHGLELGIDTIARYAKAFGLGQLTGIRLGNEKAGLIPTVEWKERVKKEPWVRGETVSAAIGQGYNLVTPLQLAMAYAALANGGKLWEPRLVLRLEDFEGNVLETREPVLRNTVGLDAAVLDEVRKGLVAVVQGERGTGARAKVEGIEVAGKTGTTQVVSLDLVEGLEEDEIPVRYRDHALFTAFAPAENAEIAVAVLVEHAGEGGGSAAAPIAQKVIAAYFDKQRADEPEAVVASVLPDTSDEVRRAPN